MRKNKKVIFIISIFFMILSCKKNDDGITPVRFNPYFQIVDTEGNDVLHAWPNEELNKIRGKNISYFGEKRKERGESDWYKTQYIKNDTAVIFFVSDFADTTFISYPFLNDVDTIVEQQNRNDRDIITQRRYYYNGKLASTLNFDANNDLLVELARTNRDSLTMETFVIKFQKE